MTMADGRRSDARARDGARHRVVVEDVEQIGRRLDSHAAGAERLRQPQIAEVHPRIAIRAGRRGLDGLGHLGQTGMLAVGDE